MEDRIKKVMSNIFDMNPNEINAESAPGTVSGWDSLKQMNLVAALEEEFNIEIDEDEIEEMVNYRVICAIISSYLED